MARRSRRRSGFSFWGPFPAYTRRTPRSSVRVTGCCLPLALGLAAAPITGALGLRRAWRFRVRSG
jgi:hypothetical protein